MPDNTHSLPIKIRKNARAKRMVLRLSPAGDEIRLTLPRYVSEKDGHAFIAKQQGWIAKQLEKRQETIPFAPECALPLFGETVILAHQKGLRGTRQENGYLYIGGEEAHFARRVEDWIRKECKFRFSETALELASLIGQQPAGISIRNTHTRWGSCSRARRLNFSWHLAFAPASVAHYVIAHEVAHLQHFDHSHAFWRCVETLDPHWKTAKNWLSQHGQSLHRYG